MEMDQNWMCNETSNFFFVGKNAHNFCCNLCMIYFTFTSTAQIFAIFVVVVVIITFFLRLIDKNEILNSINAIKCMQYATIFFLSLPCKCR